jgi:hypothetical protein
MASTSRPECAGSMLTGTLTRLIQPSCFIMRRLPQDLDFSRTRTVGNEQAGRQHEGQKSRPVMKKGGQNL